MFFATKNLVTLSMEECPAPWSFVPTEEITLEIRKDKEERQLWYGNVGTQHQFYSGLEGLNPNQRISKEGNPPHKLHAFIADLDVEIPDARIKEIVESMRYKPMWVETSLGFHRRFVWPLEKTFLVQDYGFCAAIFQEGVKWLQLHKAPGLDEQAFITPTRLYCNGCKWEAVEGAKPLPSRDCQAFFVSVGTKYAFKGAAAREEAIPLEVVEKEIKAKFPGFTWASDFTVGSQGPSFWIPESTSTMSAIVKAGGMISFAAHASKVFNKWSDILGEDFAKTYFKSAIASATEDIYWDKKCFWSKNLSGDYESRDPHEQVTLWKVSHKLSSKPDDNGVTQMDLAKNHIYLYNRVRAAVPVVMRRSGPMILNGQRILNIYNKKPIEPATGPIKAVWGSHGNFSFISAMQSALFAPSSQLAHVTAWFHFIYMRALAWAPQPSCYSYFLGGPGVGKTFLSREVFGRSLGGYVDASDYLVEGSSFNSHLYHYPYWALDDDNPSSNPASALRFQAALKKMVANDQHLNNEKFVVSGMTEWRGAIGITGNLDPVSLRILGTLDNTVLDKTNIFRCVESHTDFRFPNRTEQEKILQQELPHYLKYIVELELSGDLVRHSRWELASYQEPTLLSQVQQGSPANPFKEILLESMRRFFEQHPNDKEWRGNVRDLTALIMTDPAHQMLDRRLDGGSINRYMEKLSKEGIIRCTSEEGALKTRIWVIQRPEGLLPPTDSTTPPQGDQSKI